MKIGNFVKVVAPSHHLAIGQVVEVVEILSKHQIKVAIGFIRKPINIKDVSELIFY